MSKDRFSEENNYQLKNYAKEKSKIKETNKILKTPKASKRKLKKAKDGLNHEISKTIEINTNIKNNVLPVQYSTTIPHKGIELITPDNKTEQIHELQLDTQEAKTAKFSERKAYLQNIGRKFNTKAQNLPANNKNYLRGQRKHPSMLKPSTPESLTVRHRNYIGAHKASLSNKNSECKESHQKNKSFKSNCIGNNSYLGLISGKSRGTGILRHQSANLNFKSRKLGNFLNIKN